MTKISSLLFILLLYCCTSQGQYNITTIAGIGTVGYSGDGANATSAEITFTLGVCADKHGNVFFTDGGRVRKIDAFTNTITTVAGNGTPIYTGEGIPATAIGLRGARGICIDDSEYIYISCLYTIRKVTTNTGIISTIAGNDTGGYAGDNGSATNARLALPIGVAADINGNIYIADQHNNVIRKATKSTGIITTVAGTGISGFSGDGGPATDAQLSFNSAVAVDTAGNIYIGDNSRIRKVNAATGIINTIAGTGAFAYAGDGGPAYGAAIITPGGMAIDAANNLYITDQGYSVVRKINAATGIITTIAGTGTSGYTGDGGHANSSQLNLPYGVFANAAGSIVYVCDKGNNRIRKLSDPLAVPVVLHAASVSVQPNPSTGMVKLTTGSTDPYSLQVLNSIGRIVYSAVINDPSTDIDLTGQPAGIYFLQLGNAGNNITIKVAIVR